MTDNSKSRSRNANPKIRNSAYVNWGIITEIMPDSSEEEVNQVNWLWTNLIVICNYGSYQTNMG